MKVDLKRTLMALAVSMMFLWITEPLGAQEKTYRIDVLQVVAMSPFQNAYKGFVQELEKNGLVPGKNLTINRTIIDFDVEKAGLWKKMGLLMRIKSESSRIADEKPDLVLTIGTPATKYAKDKFISAGIPVVFTGVAFPETAGCKSLTEAGPGFTGSTVYMNVKDALRIVKYAFPSVRTVGIVHSDEETAMQHVNEIETVSTGMGLKALTKQVDKNDHLKPAAEELIAQGAEVFIVPLDAYYGLRNYEAWKELDELIETHKIPALSFVYDRTPGAVLYLGSDYGYVGSLSGQQAVKILKDGAAPGSLPILRQQDLNVMVDVERMQALNIQIPIQVLQIAKPVH